MRNALRAVMPTALALFFWVGVIRSQTQHAILRMGEAATESFDRDWRFARFGQQADGSVLDEPGDTLAAPGFDDHTWQPVQLPHDWAITGPFRIDLAGETGKLPWKGIGWYRKHFQLSSRDAGKKIFIDFDGAMAYAEVWLNGEYVGGWPYGYSSFRLDLTPYLRFGGENILAVRLNTEAWDSRWYPGAGLYRHVWLVKTAPVHVDHWGTFITTPDVRQERARVHIRTRVCNESSRRAGVTVQTSLFELDSADRPTRLVVAAPEQPVILPAGEKRPVEALVTVSSPRRWDIRTPNRYVAITRLRAAGKVIDTYYTAFGIRTLAFTARDGFLLNGRRVPIQGTCNHHDLGALGAAVNTSALQRQLRILRAMGCNALRTSHNPPAPELLELADKMGFLVWDEAFDAWKHGKKKNDYNRLFDQWHEKDLTSLVLRDRNHPSVIIWSIGNEVMDQRDTSMTRELADIVHRNDSTRPVSNGYNDPDGGRASGAPLALDVMGVNYFFGQQARWDADPRYRSMPTIGSETSSCLSSRGEYFFGTEYRNWQVSSYDLARPGWGCIPDEQFRTNARFPNLLGEFVWTGFDYLGEPTPYGSDDTNLLNFRSDPSRREELRQKLADMEKNNPPSRSSYFGIIDLCGFPKDRYYLYQAH
ncbi:MAG TPA: glycoside hydrolase family 2 TIM barrel-domain containing protein, partial [Chitinophagaceae bacterium]|nr:glycoside hydrolase family 2 TIM barrel-domain containing protein [Chitinophagaceae bacterium]